MIKDALKSYFSPLVWIYRQILTPIGHFFWGMWEGFQEDPFEVVILAFLTFLLAYLIGVQFTPGYNKAKVSKTVLEAYKGSEVVRDRSLGGKEQAYSFLVRKPDGSVVQVNFPDTTLNYKETQLLGPVKK